MIKRLMQPKGRGVVLLYLLFFMFFSMNEVAAQENEGQPPVQQMRVQVLPEYDDPRILVIAQGRLDVADGVYQGPVTFRVPANAQINQMAVLDLELGVPKAQPFDTQINPDDPAWMLVSYTLTNPHFFFEYYYPLPSSGSQKQFAFSLESFEAIGTLSLEIQQPLKAEAFTLEPTASTSRVDTAGFTYWQYPERSVAKGEEIAFQIRYTKSDPNPSINRLAGEVEPVSSVASAVNNQPSTIETPSWIGITLSGVALVIGAGFVRHRIRSRQTVGLTATAYLEETDVEPTTVYEAAPAKFCTHCGQGLPQQANFCPYCGQRVKRR